MEWVNSNSGNFEANLYGADASLTKHVILGPHAAFDGFRWRHQAIQVMGEDFLFRSSRLSYSASETYWRTSSSGTLIDTVVDSPTVYDPGLLRTGGRATTATYDLKGHLVIGGLTF